MCVFYHEKASKPNKRCKYLTSCLKDAFSNCHTSSSGRLPTSSPLEENYQSSEIDYENKVVVSLIRSRSMEKLRRKPSSLTDSFSWVYSPISRELYITTHEAEIKKEATCQEDIKDCELEREEFLSAKSDFSTSYCSSKDSFHSVKTSLSRCCSLSEIDPYFKDIQRLRRSIIKELCHCDGWPFGLCRKAVLLPPLPKCPSESWSWRKDVTKINMFKY